MSHPERQMTLVPETTSGDSHDFSIVLGGPLYQLFRKAHLSSDALEQVRRRLIAVVAITWLPLLILSALEGVAWGTSVAVPFLRDIEVQGRFLLFVPLLIGAELLVHQRLRFVARQFLDRELIPESAQPQFEAVLSSTIRLRNSTLAEIAMIILVYGVGLRSIAHQQQALAVATWHATPNEAGRTLSLAGLWYVYLSIPLMQFLLLRWYYRLFIWARFLWKLSRIELRLVPTHPDHTGGLGFLASATAGFMPLAVAHGAFVSTWIANRIFLHQGVLLDFKALIIAMTVWVLVLFLAPFLVFSGQLAQASRRGERDYGPLAERYSHEFEAKWVRGNRTSDEPLLGSADIQSLADMANAYAVVKSMRLAPITRQSVMQLGVATLAPIVPLALTMMPLKQLLTLLLGMLT